MLIAGILALQWVHHARVRRMPRDQNSEATWTTDALAAMAKARSENKTVLMNFTGSDWCGWCIKLDKEVFSTSTFATYAKENLVLVKLDFPRHKELAASEVLQNEALARKYAVEGFPTILVLQPDGTEKGRLGYLPGGPWPWLGELKKLQ